MAVSRHTVVAGQQPVGKTSESASVAELVDVILDKGIVIDAWTRCSVLGLELLTIEARMVVTSVETYLRYADALGRGEHDQTAMWPPASPGVRATILPPQCSQTSMR
jgi:hypothetical protein